MSEQQFYKLNIAKIISIVGGTISICISIFAAVLHIDRTFNTFASQTTQNTKDIIDNKTEIKNLWMEATNLQNQINNHIEDDANKRNYKSK